MAAVSPPRPFSASGIHRRRNPGGQRRQRFSSLKRVPASHRPAVCTRRLAASATSKEHNFRFFDNRQKYLLFVHTCSEKAVVAQRASMELANIHPRPPAMRVFDAGVGDGSVLTRVMRAMHSRFSTTPFYIVGKEISLEAVRLTLEKMPDQFCEHRHRTRDDQPLLPRGAVATTGLGASGHQSGMARGSAGRYHRTSVRRSDYGARALSGRRGWRAQ
jgi:hypothetical protein